MQELTRDLLLLESCGKFLTSVFGVEVDETLTQGSSSKDSKQSVDFGVLIGATHVVLGDTL